MEGWTRDSLGEIQSRFYCRNQLFRLNNGCHDSEKDGRIIINLSSKTTKIALEGFDYIIIFAAKYFVIGIIQDERKKFALVFVLAHEEPISSLD